MDTGLDVLVRKHGYYLWSGLPVYAKVQNNIRQLLSVMQFRQLRRQHSPTAEGMQERQDLSCTYLAQHELENVLNNDNYYNYY